MPPIRQRIQSLLSSPERLIWAVRVRWLAIAGFVPLAFVAHRFGLFASLTPVWQVATIGAVLNAVNGWCVQRRRHVLLVSAVAIPMDHVFSTYLILNTGGAQSPFVVVYAVQVLATAMLVDTAVAAASAVLAVALWALGLWLQAFGYVSAPPLFTAAGEPSLVVYHVTLAAFLFYCLVLLIYLGGYISERLRVSERELEERNRHLEQAVESLRRTHTELAEAYRRLQEAEAHLVHSEKMRGLGALVAGVAHELNNPISFVAGNIEHLRDYVGRLQRLVDAIRDDELPPAVAARLDKLKAELQIDAVREDLPTLLSDCEEGARRTRQIVLGLRNFSRIDSGDGWQTADVRGGIDSTLALVAHRFRNRIEVVKAYDAVPDIECILGQLNQVFLNLLINAADACAEPKGDAQVRIEVQAATLAEAAAVVIRFHDNGAGIPVEVLDRIFDPFFTTKPVGQGTGLGLSVSYGIIRRHHGSITVASPPGAGTTFTILLPVRQPAPAGCA